jgi:hypothetical protein
MDQYQAIAETHDLRGCLQGKILAQNKLLRMLQTEPQTRKFGLEAYATKPGKSQNPSNTSLEAQGPQFFADNKMWILNEVDKYLQSARSKNEDKTLDPLEEAGLAEGSSDKN